MPASETSGTNLHLYIRLCEAFGSSPLGARTRSAQSGAVTIVSTAGFPERVILTGSILRRASACGKFFPFAHMHAGRLGVRFLGTGTAMEKGLQFAVPSPTAGVLWRRRPRGRELELSGECVDKKL